MSTDNTQANGADAEDDATESRPLTREELQAMASADDEAVPTQFAAMFPPGTDVAPLWKAVHRATPAEAARAPLFFVPSGKVDATELGAFNAAYRDVLAAPISYDEAAATDFQTKEDWNGYVTTGAAGFIAGRKVRAPLIPHTPDRSDAMTFSLREGQDPAVEPLRMALFADFGNGLYAPREIARRITEGAFPYAFHLGDVYYDGNAREFAEYFEKPLAPLVASTELFMLSGNHEMYSKGEHFQRYITGKAARHPGLQRQNAEMFRLRGHGLQVIGLDTMWCDWDGKPFRGNEPRLDDSTKALLERWLTEGDPDGFNILLTSNEPFSTESKGTTKMLDDLAPFLRRGLVDLWCWGNVHHAAIWDTYKVEGTTEHGFVGACVGHGGYPFYTQGAPKKTEGAECLWSERQHRFWPYAGVRPEVGLNGWASLSLARKADGWHATLTYRDWLGRDRARATIVKHRGLGPTLHSVVENHAGTPGGADWRTLR